MEDEECRHLRQDALDPASVVARAAFLDLLESELAELAEVFQLAGSMIGPDRVSGVSTTGNADEPLVTLSFVLHTAHSLVSGARSLVRTNPYAASALVRQLVEVEYLAWAAVENPAEARDWLTSTPAARRERWQPRQLRKRAGGRFSPDEYAEHCEAGGHPTPAGVRAFITGHDKAFMMELVSWEAAKHGHSIWKYAVAAAADGILSAEQKASSVTRLADARARDRLARSRG